MAPHINILAVITAAFAQFVIGGLWYGPLFGKTWSGLTGVAQESMKPKPTALAAMMACSLIMAYVLAHVLAFAIATMNVSGIGAGLSSGFWMWLGFAAPITLGPVLYEGKPLQLWFITAGYYLVSLLAMGAILAMWR